MTDQERNTAYRIAEDGSVILRVDGLGAEASNLRCRYPSHQQEMPCAPYLSTSPEQLPDGEVCCPRPDLAGAEVSMSSLGRGGGACGCLH